ncbi:FlgO family outer membrane protein [Simplicispira psychrophila]|uniref:FlgO family outer membrane protein n=1 Tax=Simplicispira psychrophila TaxID=80882 RepID=UPI000483802F|nr:FlgO family outer membrane protein [Simplicispira psychrophila]
MKHLLICLLVAASALGLSGCARYYYGENSEVMHSRSVSGQPLAQPRTDVLLANYHAVDVLLQGAVLDPQRSVLVATLVNVDRLGESSRLGRIFSEQIAGRLVQRGVPVTELKLRESVFLQPHQGELLLSRQLSEVSQQHDAQAVVVGTYAVSAQTLYVSLKLVNPVGNTVVAASDYALPMDENVRALLFER